MYGFGMHNTHKLEVQKIEKVVSQLLPDVVQNQTRSNMSLNIYNLKNISKLHTDNVSDQQETYKIASEKGSRKRALQMP